MKLRVCELECDDSKHAGHSGAFIQRLASAAATASQYHSLFVFFFVTLFLYLFCRFNAAALSNCALQFSISTIL
jgi:hypothetical protein